MYDKLQIYTCCLWWKKSWMKTFRLTRTNDNDLEWTKHLPMTLFANELLFRVASPISPIFTDPVVPVMKILSHFKSLWMIGGVRVCRYCRPFRICRHQFFKTLRLSFLKRPRYLKYKNQLHNNDYASFANLHMWYYDHLSQDITSIFNIGKQIELSTHSIEPSWLHSLFN